MKMNYYLRGNRWTKKKGKRKPSVLTTNLPLVSVFLIKEGYVTSRGVAICSDSDNPDKYIGRWLAHINAVEARDSKKSTKPIFRKRAHRVLFRVLTVCSLPRPFDYKSEYNAILNEYEKKLIGTYDTSYNTDRAPEVQWDTGKADPVGDIKSAMRMMGKTGIKF